MGSSLCLFGAVARRDFGPQLTKRFLDLLANCIGHGRNWASLIRRQLAGGHDDALDVRARLGENALHVKIFAHWFLLCGGRPFHIIANARAAFERLVKGLTEGALEQRPAPTLFALETPHRPRPQLAPQARPRGPKSMRKPSQPKRPSRWPAARRLIAPAASPGDRLVWCNTPSLV